MTKGKLIVFCGINFLGKTMQAKRLVERATTKGIPVLFLYKKYQKWLCMIKD